MLVCKRTGLATSCVFGCHIGPNIFTSQICILHLRIRIASSHPHRIFAPSHLRSSHPDLHILYLHFHLQVFIFWNHILSSHFRVFMTWSHCPILSSSRFHYTNIYNLIYLRLQNLISLNIISPLSGQPSSSCLCFYVITWGWVGMEWGGIILTQCLAALFDIPLYVYMTLRYLVFLCTSTWIWCRYLIFICISTWIWCCAVWSALPWGGLGWGGVG